MHPDKNIFDTAAATERIKHVILAKDTLLQDRNILCEYNDYDFKCLVFVVKGVRENLLKITEDLVNSRELSTIVHVLFEHKRN